MILLLCTVCSSFILYGLPDAYSLFCHDDEVAFEFVRMVAGGMIALGGEGENWNWNCGDELRVEDARTQDSPRFR